MQYLTGQTVNSSSGKQFIGEYDVHGDYFKKWITIIVNNGIPVEIVHSSKVKVKYFMNNEEITEDEKQIMLADRAKMFFDAIKTDDLFLVEVKDDHVYCVMQ